MLFEYLTRVMPDTNNSDKRAAIQILGMCGLSEVSVITSNVQNINDFGLTWEQGTFDFKLGRLQELLLPPTRPCTEWCKLNQGDPNPPKKYESEHKLFQQLEKILVEGVEFKHDTHFMLMAKNALSLIFQLGESPDKFTSNIIRSIR